MGVFVFYFPNLLGYPDKLGRVAAMGGALIVLFIIPFINTSKIRSTTLKFCQYVLKNINWRILGKVMLWVLVTSLTSHDVSAQCMSNSCSVEVVYNPWIHQIHGNELHLTVKAYYSSEGGTLTESALQNAYLKV